MRPEINLKSCRLKNIMTDILSYDLPILDIKNRIGHTGYIDFINESEVLYPAMKGTDYNNRPFIIVKVIISNKIYIQTFFQRYYDDKELWMGCMVWNSCSFITTIGGMQMYQAILIQQIINNKSVVILPEHRPVFISKYDDLVGQTILLGDEERLKAVKLIQKNWDICRYNPDYKMCKTIFQKQLQHIYNLSKIELI